MIPVRFRYVIQQLVINSEQEKIVIKCASAQNNNNLVVAKAVEVKMTN
jgi:hypothetical protein